MTLRVSMLVRNEVDRHLTKTLDCITEMGAHAYITDDASEDATADLCSQYGAVMRMNECSMFWEHEGKARQAHLEWLDQFCVPGDWILALDADETISDPADLMNVVHQADMLGDGAISLRLYEFWTETQYRTDGYWFGTKTPRLYKWQSGGMIADKPMGCGSEPTYVQEVRKFQQDRCHLLHWGYVRPEDRIRKHSAYSARLGGHGHDNTHVNSIITEPMLRTY